MRADEQLHGDQPVFLVSMLIKTRAELEQSRMHGSDLKILWCDTHKVTF